MTPNDKIKRALIGAYAVMVGLNSGAAFEAGADILECFCPMPPARHPPDGLCDIAGDHAVSECGHDIVLTRFDVVFDNPQGG